MDLTATLTVMNGCLSAIQTQVWMMKEKEPWTKFALLNLPHCAGITYQSSFVVGVTDKGVLIVNVRSGRVEVPKNWSCSSNIIQFKNSINAELNTVDHLLSDLPFEVKDDERNIILFPRSSFILGTSATAKTTIMTMKLYRQLQQFYIDSVAADYNNEIEVGESRGSILHQLVVTATPELCLTFKKHVLELKSFAIGSNNSTTGMDDAADQIAEFRDIPNTFVGIQQEKYPLIITFHKFLMMLDSSVGKSFFHDVRDSIALQTFMRRNQVTYNRFLSTYWPHFNTKRKKNLDASRVFTEIIMHIKGGIQKGDGRDRYISLSKRKASTLTAGKRGMIYDIFEDYEKMKLERGEFDLADFVNDIHLRLKNEDLQGDKMDFVYIDEVQDLTMTQISLFKHICKNVDQGFVFCGDTIQTISRGTDFRFEDIRSLFYKEFVMKSSDCDLLGKGEEGLISDMFTLTRNFHTHTGVLRLAHSVIDLLGYYFPNSIDSLGPETSFLYGESPVVLEPGSDENLIMSIFRHNGKWVGFGADQVIIVRDDTARKEISSYIGLQAVILTIPECRGLEFQDVLFYNFFGSSPLSNEWRVVYGFLERNGLLDGGSPVYFPSFSQSRHNILCSELKQLYVAITRTRQRLWICDSNVELAKPMFDYWKSSSLVQVRKMDDSLAEAMHRTSSPEEWKSQGIKLFWGKNFEMAMMCFEKVGEETWEKRAKASRLRATAESIRGSNSDEADVMIREAAEILNSIGRFESAAECFCDLGEYETAGMIYLEKCGTAECRKAGECFRLAGNYKTAAEVFVEGKFFGECLSACTEGNCFELGLQYIESWKEQASVDSAMFKEMEQIAHKYLENCAFECHKAKDKASVMKFVGAFHTMESKHRLLKSLHCLEELLVFEEQSGNFNEAAEIARSRGDILREIDLLEKAEQFANASSLIIAYVLSNSLWRSGNQGWPLKPFPRKAQLLDRAKSLAQKVSETFRASICVETDILSSEVKNLSELMQCYSASKQCNTPVGYLLSVRKLLESHFQVNRSKYELDTELHLDSRSFRERISRNQFSTGALAYLWNSRKKLIVEIIECLKSLGSSNDSIKCEGIFRISFDYFGVRMLDNSRTTLQLMNPNAAWVRDVNKGDSQRPEAATLEACHFASAAREYWHQELVHVGLGVLEALQEINSITMGKHSLISCPCVWLLHIFDIAKFLLKLKSVDMKNTAKKLREFLKLSTRYKDFVTPFDPRLPVIPGMICIRETEVSKNLLEEIVSTSISSTRDELTYGQIGQIATIMLGTSKRMHGLYDRIAQRLSKDTYWKSFVEILKKESPFSQELHRALEETFKFQWRMVNECMSPTCFFYLVERLIILASHSQDHFFTTRSSFVEYLLSLSSDANPQASFVIDKESCSMTMNFVARVVRHCLSNSSSIRGWIKSCHIDNNYYFPALILRLVVILCILYLNNEFHYNEFLKLLDLPDIKSQLLTEFVLALRSSNLDESAIAGAFNIVRDPLLIVAPNENEVDFTCRDAIVLDFKLFSSRNEIIESLFPRSPHIQSTKFDMDVLESHMQIKWGLIRETSDALESLRDRNDEQRKSLVFERKVQMLEHIKCFTTFAANLAYQKVRCDKDKNFVSNVRNMVKELETLSRLLKSSDLDVEAGLSETVDFIHSLEAKRPELDRLVSPLILENNPNRAKVLVGAESSKASKGKKKEKRKKSRK